MQSRAIAACLGFVAIACLAASHLIGPRALAQETNAHAKPEIGVVLQLGHRDGAQSAACSGDGVIAASGGNDGSIKLWELDTGRELRTLVTRSGAVFFLDLSPDGKRLLSIDSKEILTLWDTETGRELRRVAECCVKVAVFSKDGKFVVSGGQHGRVILWDASTGRQVKAFRAKQPSELRGDHIESLALSPDGRYVFTAGIFGSLRLWNVSNGSEMRTFKAGHRDRGSNNGVGFSPDGRYVVSGGTNPSTVKLWDVQTGKEIRSFPGAEEVLTPSYSVGVAISRDGRYALAGGSGILVWDLAEGKQVRHIDPDTNSGIFTCPAGEHRVISVGASTNAVKLWDVGTGDLVRTLAGYSSNIAATEVARQAVAMSPDGRLLLSGGPDAIIRVWDARTGRLTRSIQADGQVLSLKFLSDGRSFLASAKTISLYDAVSGGVVRTLSTSDAFGVFGYGMRGEITLSKDRRYAALDIGQDVAVWDLEQGRELRRLRPGPHNVTAAALAPDGAYVAASDAYALKLWDVTSGRVIWTLSPGVDMVAYAPDGRHILAGSEDNGRFVLLEAATGRSTRSFEWGWGMVASIALSPDGKYVLVGRKDREARLIEIATGRELTSLKGHDTDVRAVAFHNDGTRAVTATNGGVVRVWSVASTRLLAQIAARDDKWITITPAGFFDSGRGEVPLHLVQGLQTVSFEQVYDHLYRPDLVEALLSGDAEGKYTDAASKLNLETMLDSGPPPQIETLPGRRTERAGDAIRIALRLVDTGGGIGEKVVWRVNGVTQGEISDPNASRTGVRIIEQTLKLAPGQDNSIEITAYNRAGLLASTPWRHIEGKFGEVSGARMHILAVGVSEYAHKDWRLSYAARDAKAFAELMQAAGKGKGLYDDVKSEFALERNATEKGIEAAIERMRGNVAPNDVFILYLAGHGRNIAGTYYFLPQDLVLDGGRTVARDAIDQAKLQRWLASIPAQKSILILDTCESEVAAREISTERQTAVERLRHATGRSVIAAASAAAYEGYNGHGLLTWAIRDAFTQRDAPAGEFVELLSLAAHINAQVPTISRKWLGIVQQPYHKIEGNFPLGIRLANVPNVDIQQIPKTPTHVFVRPERVREKAAADSPGLELPPGTQVRIVRLFDTWALVAREGQELGYVPVDVLVRLQ